MGGTFMSLDEQYRDYFIRNLHDALSGHVSNDIKEAVWYGLCNLYNPFLPRGSPLTLSHPEVLP